MSLNRIIAWRMPGEKKKTRKFEWLWLSESRHALPFQTHYCLRDRSSGQIQTRDQTSSSPSACALTYPTPRPSCPLLTAPATPWGFAGAQRTAPAQTDPVPAPGPWPQPGTERRGEGPPQERTAGCCCGHPPQPHQAVPRSGSQWTPPGARSAKQNKPHPRFNQIHGSTKAMNIPH